MSGGQGGDASINLRITQANKVIDNANARVQPKIDDQQKIIDRENSKTEARVADIQSQISDIDKQVSALDDIIKGLVDQKRSVLAQRKRAEQAKERDALAKKKSDLLKLIDETRNAPNTVVDAAKAEIGKIRSEVESEIKQARDVINGLTSELGKNVDTNKIQSDIDEQNGRIKAASTRLDELTAEKFKLETQNRQLEVEVGPIKYIAQLVYGDVVDMNMLERAVRYMILILIFVFDPLAILMLIASNQGMAEWKDMLKEKAKAKAKINNTVASKGENTESIRDEPSRIVEQATVEPYRYVIRSVPSTETDNIVPDDIKQPIDAMVTVDEHVSEAIIEQDGNDLDRKAEVEQVEQVEQAVSDSVDDSTSKIDSNNDTEELLEKLQKIHEVRLQRFGAGRPSNNNVR